MPTQITKIIDLQSEDEEQSPPPPSSFSMCFMMMDDNAEEEEHDCNDAMDDDDDGSSASKNTTPADDESETSQPNNKVDVVHINDDNDNDDDETKEGVENSTDNNKPQPDHTQTTKTEPMSIEERLQKQWDEMYHNLKLYKQKHGHCNVPQTKTNPETKKLQNWIRTQRTNRKRRKLSTTRQKCLEAIGFVWNATPTKRRRRMVEGKKEEEDVVVVEECDAVDHQSKVQDGLSGVNSSQQEDESEAENEEEDDDDNMDGDDGNIEKKSIRNKSNRQRSSNEQIKKKNQTPKNINEKFEQQWDESFHRLKSYNDRHGNINVTRSQNSKLYRWIKRQRYSRNINKLSQRRIQRLDSIGFIWDGTATKEGTCKRKKACNDDCEEEKEEEEQSDGDNENEDNDDNHHAVSSIIMSKLKQKNGFVDELEFPTESRKNKRKTKINPTKQNKAQEEEKVSADIVADDTNVVVEIEEEEDDDENESCSSSASSTAKSLPEQSAAAAASTDPLENVEKEWSNMYHKLQKYKQRHGDCLVSKSHEDQELYVWVQTQRNRIKRLQQLDFLTADCTSEVSVRLQEEDEKESSASSALSGDSNGLEKENDDDDNNNDADGNSVNDCRKQKNQEISYASDTNDDEDYGYEEVTEDVKECKTADKEDKPKMLFNYDSDKDKDSDYEGNENENDWEETIIENSKEEETTIKERPKTKSTAKKRAEQQWNNMFLRLKSYKQESDKFSIPKAQDLKLYSWIRTQRLSKQKQKLNLSRIKRLDDIGFDWNGEKETKAKNEQQWNEMFTRLEKFKLDHGHCLVPRRYKPDTKLSRWVHYQREKTKISDDKKEQLESIGFVWSVRNNKDRTNLEAEGEGDDNLHSSVSSSSKLHAPRQKPKRKLRGCVREHLQKKDNNDWNHMFQKLEKYKLQHGNFNVKRSKNTKLFNWVKRQRYNKKIMMLSACRIIHLESIGFTWDRKDSGTNSPNAAAAATSRRHLRSSKDKSQSSSSLINQEKYEQKWNEMLRRLQNYKLKHGDCRVPKSYAEDKELASWVITQRRRKSRGIMSASRQHHLDSIDFIWDATQNEQIEQQWKTMFQRLQDYKRTNGTCFIQKKKDKKLYLWAHKQRAKYEKGKLDEFRFESLMSIGFVWNIKDTNKKRANKSDNDNNISDRDEDNDKEIIVIDDDSE